MKKLAISHPGYLLRAAIKKRVTITALAKHLDNSRPQLASLINGRGRISPLLSLKLDEAFAKPPGFWSDVQYRYDLEKARKIKRKRLKPILKPEDKELV